MKFNDRLSQLRKEKKLSRDDLANKLGVSYSTVSKYESGTREPDLDTLEKISNIFNVTTDYLLGKSNNPNMTEEEEFQKFIKDPELEQWYRELPNSDEDDLRRLRDMWKIMKNEKD